MFASTADRSHPTIPCDRRAWVRHGCDHEALCQPGAHTSGQAWFARVQNISVAGLALILHRRFEVGTLLTVTVQLDQESTRAFLVRVTRLELLTAHPGLRWLAGSEFVEPLNEQSLRALRDGAHGS